MLQTQAHTTLIGLGPIFVWSIHCVCMFVCVTIHCIMSALQTCLCLQSARYLLKNLLGSQTGRAPQGSASYLGNAKAEMKSKCEVSKAKQWREPDVQLAALRCCIVTRPTSILQHSVRACRLSHCTLCCSWQCRPPFCRMTASQQWQWQQHVGVVSGTTSG